MIAGDGTPPAQSGPPVSPSELVAHTPNAFGQWHLLESHLRGTARRAHAFAADLGPEAQALAYWLGLLHDIGKARPVWQQYLRDQAIGIGRRGSGGDHKGAGALHGKAINDVLAFAIVGHHGGLQSQTDFLMCMKEWAADGSHVPDALAAARRGLPPDILRSPGPLALPGFVRSVLQFEFFARMLFSCLVDADFLDTEEHADGQRTDQRSTSGPDLTRLWEQLSGFQDSLIAERAGTSCVNDTRARIYRHAVAMAGESPGLFRLTVPTGGGKTLTALAFALSHAIAHGQRRVIAAIPYTSITDQTAAVYRHIFGDQSGAVLEHHSAIRAPESSVGADDAEAWRRLAAENWDAPIVVTTTVQLFESLLGKDTSACRKVHNIANSFVILDEAQLLPPHLLGPFLDVLRELVTNYRATVVLCTATQPAFEAIPEYRDFAAAARELAPDPAALFRDLKRVNYRWPPPGEKVSWETVAESMRASSQVLAIVNTKRDAMALMDALADPDAAHLSTLLCPRHRQAVLRTVHSRLAADLPCRLVATQVIEAGVDVDFPVVLRAFGPLTSIIQAAGRCNREGLLASGKGQVVIFDPLEGGLPPGDYLKSTHNAARLLRLLGPNMDVDNPDIVRQFFASFYGLINIDKNGVQALRRVLNFPTTALKARLIEDDSVSVVVPYRGPDGTDRAVDVLLDRARTVRTPGLSRGLLRALQPYMVQIRRRQTPALMAAGLMEELAPGRDLFIWHGVYDSQARGLQADHRLDPETLVI